MQSMHGDTATPFDAAFWALFKRYQELQAQELQAAKVGNRAPALAASSSEVSTVKDTRARRRAA